jgi:hypothetical protein
LVILSLLSLSPHRTPTARQIHLAQFFAIPACLPSAAPWSSGACRRRRLGGAQERVKGGERHVGYEGLIEVVRLLGNQFLTCTALCRWPLPRGPMRTGAHMPVTHGTLPCGRQTRPVSLVSMAASISLLNIGDGSCFLIIFPSPNQTPFLGGHLDLDLDLDSQAVLSLGISFSPLIPMSFSPQIHYGSFYFV